MKKTVRILCAVLCIVLCMTALLSCSEKTMLSLDDKTLSVNVYQFLLSRMKGTLAYYGYDVENENFWNTVTDMQGTTYDDYFRETIKAQAINYIVADKLFDDHGLILDEDDEAQVDKLLGEYVKRAGSKAALNEELKEYGVNYDILREVYILEAKIERLKEHLYGKEGEKISYAEKEEYFNENYVAFKQIFLATYSYVIDEDRFGDQVYYTDEKHTEIAYDKVNGTTKKNEFGKVVEDVLGDPEYYTADGKIAYDSENGVLGYVTNDDGDKVINDLDDDAKAELHDKAKNYSDASSGNPDLFEELIELYDESDNDGMIYLYSSAGYYAAQNDSVAYFDDIAEKLAGLEAGECDVYQSDYGYHVICRYENEAGAYDKEENEDIFKLFYDDLISRLFEELCSSGADEVDIDNDVFEGAPALKDVGINTLY